MAEVARRRLHREHGKARLCEPVVRDRRNRLSGGLRERLPQIRRGRVAVLMRGDIVPNPLPEDVLSQELLQHTKNRCAFLIGQCVEHLLRLGRRADFGTDRTRRVQGIHAEGNLFVPGELHPRLPIRSPVIHNFAGEPGRKGFIQPEVLPPPHRYEIAKPLVDDLVGNDICHTPKAVRRSFGDVNEKTILAKEDRSPVLHGAHCKVRHTDKIQLRDGIFQAEIVVQPRQAGLHHLFGEFRQAGKFRPAINRDARFLDFEFIGHQPGDAQGDEIRRHGRSFFKSNPLAPENPVAFLGFALHVRERHQLLRELGRDPK